jgi:exodeoxyribonuclease VII small subunit
MSEKKFEEAMKRLESIVESLEKGDLSLEESLKVFEEGMKLLHFCSRKLEEAEQKVTVLIKQSGGKVAQQPFDVDDKEDQ